MDKRLIRILILLAYCVPYAYLAMQGDVNSGTMIFYGFMIVCLGVLLGMAIITKNTAILMIGNILSFISSYICMLKNKTERWSFYFKPLTATNLLILITIVAFIIQLVFVYIPDRGE